MRKPKAKERILETAGKLFSEKGYSEVGINEIIDKAETAKASFYQYYPSKEILCEAWLESVHDRSEVSRAELLSSDRTPAEMIEFYFGQLQSYMENSQFRGCPYTNTSAVSDPSCDGILSQIHGHKESIREFFREVCAKHFSDEEKAREIGDRIFLLYSGAATETQNLKDLWPVDAARSAALSFLE